MDKKWYLSRASINKNNNNSIYEDSGVSQKNPIIIRQLFRNYLLWHKMWLEKVELAAKYYQFEGR